MGNAVISSSAAENGLVAGCSEVADYYKILCIAFYQFAGDFDKAAKGDFDVGYNHNNGCFITFINKGVGVPFQLSGSVNKSIDKEDLKAFALQKKVCDIQLQLLRLAHDRRLTPESLYAALNHTCELQSRDKTMKKKALGELAELVQASKDDDALKKGIFVKRLVKVGPLWNSGHAKRVAFEYLKSHSRSYWNGHWHTIVPGKMSVLHIWAPWGVKPEPWIQANSIN
mmetsp:Transcript_9996/g.18186  ORF Transcript_9996/g.18186 Transcript_9996/m.18186 type:complete len:227 (-) Transcript_9996:46-726(-)